MRCFSGPGILPGSVPSLAWNGSDPSAHKPCKGVNLHLPKSTYSGLALSLSLQWLDLHLAPPWTWRPYVGENKATLKAASGLCGLSRQGAGQLSDFCMGWFLRFLVSLRSFVSGLLPRSPSEPRHPKSPFQRTLSFWIPPLGVAEPSSGPTGKTGKLAHHFIII